MTTALTLITDAMAQANLTESGQSLPSEEAQTGLRALNRLMGKWSQMRLLIPALAQYTVTLNGAASYTIGPTGVVVGLRPIKVLSATATDAAGTDYEVHLRTQEQWDAIPLKDVDGGPPDQVWYQPTLGNGRLWVYPRSTGYTLQLDAQALVASFPSLTTDLTLPEGYEAAIVPSLADELCSTYGVQTPGDVLRRAAGAVRALKRTNSEPIRADHDLAEIGRNSFIIERGY